MCSGKRLTLQRVIKEICREPMLTLRLSEMIIELIQVTDIERFLHRYMPAWTKWQVTESSIEQFEAQTVVLKVPSAAYISRNGLNCPEVCHEADLCMIGISLFLLSR
eukprot:TRINITY_DN17174_c0_g1_i1.p1 TRINITY_DN17174_c0_g1~~TRINITY_DN17174_c0_g1_i1.p1  ORF type:complete len:107 (-),score=3.96 TRINITY_DN17174_c0_g1_i1:532-852(-)